MRLRIITSIIGIPLLLGIVILGGEVLKISLGFISIVGMYEFYKAMDIKVNTIKFVGYFFALIFIFFIFPNTQLYFIFFICFLFSLFLSIIFFHKKYNIIDVGVTFIGFVYVCILLFFIIQVREYTLHGEFFVWLIFISAWGSDTAAYFTGLSIGKHKLSPELSPNKTIEGSLGGVIGGALLSFIYGHICIYFEYIPISNFPIMCAIIGGIGAVASQLGDLTASSIKRYVKIKDYGNLFPGHGGVLDRFDSILFTAPLVYYLIILYKFLF
ncbi:phosphatidate cytidylyltransferase [Defluviitalea phaphyphila]|uniref:phosphatidate cytidylyltransferase n=1 Tax=Defluviitalea phaphyphila TaxID=1473580 RepID=UPI000731DF15|nr:phosphatidate cytidylyltransferase [Defluviitalea phaphyphila]